MSEKEQWYSNQELYEMMVELSKTIEKANAELEKTQIMIRDYNGLREKVDKCDRRLHAIEGQSQGGKDMWGYVVGGIGLVSLIISYAIR